MNGIINEGSEWMKLNESVPPKRCSKFKPTLRVNFEMGGETQNFGM